MDGFCVGSVLLLWVAVTFIALPLPGPEGGVDGVALLGGGDVTFFVPTLPAEFVIGVLLFV